MFGYVPKWLFRNRKSYISKIIHKFTQDVANVQSRNDANLKTATTIGNILVTDNNDS